MPARWVFITCYFPRRGEPWVSESLGWLCVSPRLSSVPGHHLGPWWWHLNNLVPGEPSSEIPLWLCQDLLASHKQKTPSATLYSKHQHLTHLHAVDEERENIQILYFIYPITFSFTHHLFFGIFLKKWRKKKGSYQVCHFCLLDCFICVANKLRITCIFKHDFGFFLWALLFVVDHN